GNAFVETMQNRAAVSIMKLMLGEAVRHPAVAASFAKIGPGRGLAVLTRYLTAQMDAGVLRRTDPGAAARCFVGPILVYVLTRELFVLPDAQALKPQVMV